MSEAVQQLEQQNHQREGAKFATFAALKSKKRATDSFAVRLDPEGDKLGFRFRALTRDEFNDIAADHPATEKQLSKNPTSDVNEDTFPAALLAKVCVEPKMSYEQWLELYSSPEWSGGELVSLFLRARNLCQRPLEITPFD